jgi:hypothetical protein
MTRAKDVKENTSNEVQYIMTRAKDVKENTSDEVQYIMTRAKYKYSKYIL